MTTDPEYWDPKDGDRMTTHLTHLDALAIQIQAATALHRSNFPTEGLTDVADDFLDALEAEALAAQAQKDADAAKQAEACKTFMKIHAKDGKQG